MSEIETDSQSKNIGPRALRKPRAKSLLKFMSVVVMSNETRGAICRAVTDAHFGFLQDTIEDMKDVMLSHDGIGLAGCQVGLWLNLAIIQLRIPNEVEQPLYVICNPQVISSSGEQSRVEGCLSIMSEMRSTVKRAQYVHIKYQDENGKWCELEAEGLLAHAIQHEMDHMHGLYFIDRLRPLARKLMLSKYSKRTKTPVW